MQEDVRALDSITFSEWFEGKGGSRGSIDRLWDPIAYALGFIDCDHISARCMLTIFQARGGPCDFTLEITLDRFLCVVVILIGHVDLWFCAHVCSCRVFGWDAHHSGTTVKIIT